MPVYAADVLPDTSGRNLGSAPQRWNLYAENLDVQGNVNYRPVGGVSVGLSGVVYVAAVPITANANTTGVQALSSCTIPAGLLNGVGKVLRGTMGGTYTTMAGQSPALMMAVGLGGVLIGEIWTAVLTAGQNSNKWIMKWEITVAVAGSAGQFIPQAEMLYQPTNGSFAATLLIDPNRTLAGPVNFTIAESLTTALVFNSNTSPANILTQDQFIVEVLN